MDVLCTKHPDTRPPSVASLDVYSKNPPEMVPVDITDNVMSEVAGRLLGGAGTGGTDSVSLQHWLLRFGGGEWRTEVGCRRGWGIAQQWAAPGPPIAP